MKDRIKRATAIYTGGNVYLYYAELLDGNWIFCDGDSCAVLNENPLRNQETFDASCCIEWQQAHMIKEITEENEIRSILRSILAVIFNGKTIPEWDNFAEPELQRIYSRNK